MVFIFLIPHYFLSLVCSPETCATLEIPGTPVMKYFNTQIFLQILNFNKIMKLCTKFPCYGENIFLYYTVYYIQPILKLQIVSKLSGYGKSFKVCIANFA